MMTAAKHSFIGRFHDKQSDIQKKALHSKNRMQSITGSSSKGIPNRVSASGSNSVSDFGKDVNDRHSVEKKLEAGFIGFGDGAERKPWPVQDRSERIECFAEVH